MLGGMVLELEPAENAPKWAFVCAGLGDCKAFHWSSKTGEVIDITVNNRQNITDARDPGGRLGPYLEMGAPDLRNLKIYFHPCEAGDIIFIISDGVHDNFDPQSLGKSPKELNINAESWSQIDSKDPVLYAETEKVKYLFANKFLNTLIGGAKSLQPATRTTPSLITNKLTEHSLQLTKPARHFMEQNWNKKLPPDYAKYPGKMDHATCVAFEVGLKKSDKQPPVHKVSNKDPSQYWEVYTTDSGEKYFYNTITKKSSWEDPFLKKKDSQWHAYYDENGEIYYFNSVSKECSWNTPDELMKNNGSSDNNNHP
jgi:hypothetical protein